MFEVGFTEIILIFGIALLVLGPARLPKLAADLGRWAGRARSMARQLRTQLEQEVQLDPLATSGRSKPAGGPDATIHTPPPRAPTETPHAALAGDDATPGSPEFPAALNADPPGAAPTSADTTTPTPDERQPG